MEKSEFINVILTFLSSSAFSQSVGIVAFLSSVYFYKKSKKSRVPTYIVRTINLVKDKIQKIDTVEIRYNGDVVRNLSISKIAFWNDGKETINSTDIASAKPIKVRIDDDCIFLDADIVYTKNDANNFNFCISEDKKTIDLSFDYCDYKEGIVLQIYHTGNGSTDLFIDGQVKSVKKIIRKNLKFSILPDYFNKLLNVNYRKGLTFKERRTISGWTFLITGLMSAILFPYVFLNDSMFNVQSQTPKDQISIVISFVIAGLLYIWLGFSIIRKSIPSGFDVFNEEM